MASELAALSWETAVKALRGGASDAQGISLMQPILDAAENRGREQHHAMNPALEHAGLVCEGCAALVEKEREEKRVEFARLKANLPVYVQTQHTTDLWQDALTWMQGELLPLPTPPVPEWCKEAVKRQQAITASDHTVERLRELDAEAIHAAYLAHAPKVDAGELAEAAIAKAEMYVGRMLPRTKAEITAAIRAVLERGE